VTCHAWLFPGARAELDLAQPLDYPIKIGVRGRFGKSVAQAVEGGPPAPEAFDIGFPEQGHAPETHRGIPGLCFPIIHDAYLSPGRSPPVCCPFRSVALLSFRDRKVNVPVTQVVPGKTMRI
jgi:hypothetical protein